MTDNFPYKFRPQKDITAYELAIIFVSDNALNANDTIYETMPDFVKRHYEKDVTK